MLEAKIRKIYIGHNNQRIINGQMDKYVYDCAGWIAARYCHAV
jgi:hypothetical protein